MLQLVVRRQQVDLCIGRLEHSGITGLPGGSSVPLDVVAHPVTTNVFIVAVEQSGGTGGGVYRTTNSAAFTAATGFPSTSTDGYRKLDISLKQSDRCHRH